MKKILFAAITAIALITTFAFTATKDEKVTLIVTHEVKSYDEWKKAFDSNAEGRKKAGIKMINIFTSVENPNIITVVSEAPSAQAVRDFASSPEMKAMSEKAGVIGKPDVKILNKAE